MNLTKEELELIKNTSGFSSPEKEKELVKYLEESLSDKEKEHIKNLFKLNS